MPHPPPPLNWQNPFVRQVGICVGILLGIHLLDYLNFFDRRTPASSVRLFCTVVYFGTLLYLCWLMLRPRKAFFKELHEWQYEDCPQTIQRAARSCRNSLDLLLSGFIFLAMMFIGSSAVFVFSYWYPTSLAKFRELNGLVWFVSLVGILIYWTSPLFKEMLDKRRALHDELDHLEMKPRSLADLFASNSLPVEHPDGADAPPVVVRPSPDAYKAVFTAGGIEWRWQDFTPNCVVFGQAGAGKTVCVLNALLDGLLSVTAHFNKKSSALVLDPKGDFRDKLRIILRRLGRLDDLMILDPASPESITWNPLDSPDDELELANRFVAVMEILDAGKEGGDPFWINAAKQFFRHAIALLRLAYPDHPPTLQQILLLAPQLNPGGAGDSLLGDCVRRIDVKDHRSETCLQFFAEQWRTMPAEQHAGVLGQITNMLDPFTLPPYNRIISGKSTMRMGDLLKEGKILYLGMPIAEKEAMTRTIGTFLKLAYYREVLRVINKKWPSIFFCDEFQAFFTPSRGGDADFFERSRQSFHANIIGTQNLPALLKQSPREEPAMNLLGNCAVKIFLRNSDPKTNEYASKLWGERLEGMGSTSPQATGRMGSLTTATTGSRTDTWLPVVRPEEFGRLDIPVWNDNASFAASLIRLGSRAEVEKHAIKRRWKKYPLDK
jgi:hypothetical protein